MIYFLSIWYHIDKKVKECLYTFIIIYNQSKLLNMCVLEIAIYTNYRNFKLISKIIYIY